MDDNLEERCGSVPRCPISITRPDMKTRQKMASGSFNEILKKIILNFFTRLGPANGQGGENNGMERKGGISHLPPKFFEVDGCGIRCRF